MQVVVDSLLTAYRRYGQPGGQPVLLLHGWGDKAESWQAFADGLEGLDVYAVDLPGFGGSDMPSTAWGLDEYAGFVAAFLHKIGLNPYAVIGHSNGGAIAIRGLAGGAFVAEKLVLLASAGVRSEYKGRNKAVRMVAKTGKALAMPLPAAVKQRLRRKLYTTVGSDMLVAEHLQETFKKIVDDDVQADAARLELPVLLVYGEEDVATPQAFGRLLQSRIGGSRFELVTGAGHFVHQDEPAAVRRLVQEFLT